MALVDTLESAWYGDSRAPWWTQPLAALYSGAIHLRRALYHLGWLHRVQLNAPVIVIGNISVGGTGKTPLTIAVVAALRARGYRPGVVSRGYGGSQRKPLLLGDTPDPAQVGDEPCLIHASGVPVAVGRDRPAAAQLLLDAGCGLAVDPDAGGTASAGASTVSPPSLTSASALRSAALARVRASSPSTATCTVQPSVSADVAAVRSVPLTTGTSPDG